jgi:hypothetical protein
MGYIWPLALWQHYPRFESFVYSCGYVLSVNLCREEIISKAEGLTEW